ncbi:unnamed protein product [Parnassius apollo]|uniref:(apollo) hypothetical protein n=1 Tax=Parnassius apollo TaxID=110799 RepID=A0A8S3YBB4_PARAO|nr:unnamed protein product [Parnassius apollo]
MTDRCADQNKNTTVLGMCQKWLTEAPQHIKKMELIFPVVCQYFLPAYRIFGRIVKEFRKRDKILEPTGYTNIMTEYSNLILVGQECPVKDWKDTAKKGFKTRWSLACAFYKVQAFYIEAF